jgi:pyrimidine operon attenuation protein/uracil phosphoribosyltransferase
VVPSDDDTVTAAVFSLRRVGRTERLQIIQERLSREIRVRTDVVGMSWECCKSWACPTRREAADVPARFAAG